jgi:serine/threonine protein kinase
MAETGARFQLLELIGRGTLGELYRARDLEYGRTVALRLVEPQFTDDPAARAALVDAANRAAAASHPSLAAIYECGADDSGSVYIAGEFVPGQRLSALVSGSPLNARRALDIGAQVADALATAHAHGLVHGALSTSAVLVTPRGIAKVVDTGLLQWTRRGASQPQDDFTALGALLFEMLVGRPLKTGWPGELRLPVLLPCTRDLLDGLTAGRFDAMATVAASVRACAQELEASPAAPPRPPLRVQQPSSFRTLPIVIAVAILAAAAWWFAVR